MADNTDRFGLNTYSQGDTNWDHTDTVQTIDELAIERGAAADRPDSGDYDDELYLATDQQILYRWDADATDWIVEGVGSETDPLPKVWANEIDVNTLEAEDTHTERIGGGEYHYAGDYDGTDPDERLDNCLNEADDGHRIYLEHTTYSDDRTIDKGILISGPASTSGASDVRIEGTWTLDQRIILKYITCRTDDAIVVAADRCSLFGVAMGGNDSDIFVDADNSVISHIWASSQGQVTFADGTSGNEIGIVSGETTISDNGNNSVL